jgi:hypothetical protein
MPATPAPDTHIKVVMVVKVYKDIVIVGVFRRDVPGRGLLRTPAPDYLKGWSDPVSVMMLWHFILI